VSGFQNTKEIEIPTVGSKGMASRSELMHFAQFLGYLNRFNSISTHEQSLEREFNNLCNDTSFNPFQRLDQN